MPAMPRPLDKNVYRLGLLSLFNDITADMITPLLPAFLATMGMGATFLGAMEGVANCLSHTTMLFAGIYVDRHGKNKKATVLGYYLCAFVRLLIAIPIPAVTFLVRVTDRIGKGIRTAPRDSLMTHLVPKKDWGRAFGVQRAMDHTGTMIGATLAALLIAQFSLNLSILFILASLPSILSVLIVPRKIPEVPHKKSAEAPKISWRDLPPSLRPYIFVIFFSAIATPSELFLILKMKDMGLKEYLMPLAWFLMTLFSVLAAYVGGYFSDRTSRRLTMAVGWFIASLAYLGFAWFPRLGWAWAFLALYGLSAGWVEAAQRSYPVHMASDKVRATVLGWYYLAYGMGLLIASLLFGVLWKYWSVPHTFTLYAGLMFLCVFLVSFLPSSRAPAHAARSEG